jgi:hypothetical protein
MSVSRVESHGDESNGLRRISTGSAIGLAAGVIGLGLPITLILLPTLSPGTIYLTGPELIETTAGLALVGAVLFAVSLLVFRLGFAALRGFDRRFWTASILCMIGTVGVILIVVPIALAASSSDAIARCIQGAPSRTLACVSSVAPLASYWAIAAFWLLWLGGLGIVVGITLAGRRYRQIWLYLGAALYAVLLLGLLAPLLGLLFPIGALTYPLLAAPFLVLLGAALIFQGSRRAMRPG